MREIATFDFGRCHDDTTITHDSHDLRIDGDRLWHGSRRSGEIGAIEGPNGEHGCARLALTDVDRDGRDLVVVVDADLGMDVVIDAIGNVVATRPGSDPDGGAVMTGSHIDTVRPVADSTGTSVCSPGWRSSRPSSTTASRPAVRSVAFFTDEEGARFAPDMLGSLVYVGGMAVEEALDVLAADDGARLGDELAAHRLRRAHAVPAARLPHAYVELHIEQGPILEDEGVTIGVVDGVQGISWTEVTITGRSAHAGTTPMRMRRDAGYVAAASRRSPAA